MGNKPVRGQVADSSIELEVSLPSGRFDTFVVSQCGSIADLKLAGLLPLTGAF